LALANPCLWPVSVLSVGGARRKPVVEVRRSERRRRTVSAYREGERVVVLIPSQFSRAEESEWVDKMLARLAAREQRSHRSDNDLAARGRQLAARYLPEFGSMVHPDSIRWVANQHGRWGSCTPSDRSVRISEKVRDMPSWVSDYVILHEIAHLVIAGHNARFWELVQRYPRCERARGYLEGVSAVQPI